MFGLKGHMPVASKLFCRISNGIEFQVLMIDETVKYLALAVSLREEALSLTEFERRNEEIFNLNVDAIPTSKGCITCIQCPGNVINLILWVARNFTAVKLHRDR